MKTRMRVPTCLFELGVEILLPSVQPFKTHSGGGVTFGWRWSDVQVEVWSRVTDPLMSW